MVNRPLTLKRIALLFNKSIENKRNSLQLRSIGRIIVYVNLYFTNMCMFCCLQYYKLGRCALMLSHCACMFPDCQLVKYIAGFNEFYFLYLIKYSAIVPVLEWIVIRNVQRMHVSFSYKQYIPGCVVGQHTAHRSAIWVEQECPAGHSCLLPRPQYTITPSTMAGSPSEQHSVLLAAVQGSGSGGSVVEKRRNYNIRCFWPLIGWSDVHKCHKYKCQDFLRS